MSILSLHSHVALGHVGNSACVFPLQRLGHEVWPVHTVQLGHHPGHGAWHGHRVAPTDVAEVLAGLQARGAFAACRAVLTGYLGSPEMGALALDAWAAVRQANPDTLICCDPILGDETEGLYVAEELAAFYRDHAVRAADVIFPNRFELAFLSDRSVDDPVAAVTAARELLGRGPAMVLATSVPADGMLSTLLVTSTDAWSIPSPLRPLQAKGAGDFFAARWLGGYLTTGDAVEAMATAVAATQALIAWAVDHHANELPLIAAQEAWAAPTVEFAAHRLDA